MMKMDTIVLTYDELTSARAATPCIILDGNPAMYEWKKHMDPNHGMPEHWAKLLRKTHEVSCRIAKAIRRTIDHTDGPNGSARFQNPPPRDPGFDGNLDGLRQEL